MDQRCVDLSALFTALWHRSEFAWQQLLFDCVLADLFLEEPAADVVGEALELDFVAGASALLQDYFEEVH
jgi:hypothetical protein